MGASEPNLTAIIGCGLIGKKRALSLPRGSLGALFDINSARSEALARELQRSELVASGLEDILANPQIKIIVVATLNSSLGPITLQAVKKGKHVLVEKPGSLSSVELQEIALAAEKSGSLVRVGYNHRYHPALLKAREIVDSGAIGPLMMIRGRYGHGGRVGYEKEWRADPKLSGGGELMDQGVHLIDLAGWFLGEFSKINGSAHTYFWEMPVDDNAFLDLKTPSGQTAWLHVSCSEWKNLFSFEIYGRDGKLHIEGLGGSYGVEGLSHYQMLPKMGPPDTTIYEYPAGDNSWALEMQDFVEDIKLKRSPSPGLRESIATIKVVETIYRS